MACPTCQEKRYSIFTGTAERSIAGMTVTFEAGLKVKWWTESTPAHFRVHTAPIKMSRDALLIHVSSPRQRALMEFSCPGDARRAKEAFKGSVFHGREVHCDLVGAYNSKILLQNLPATISRSQLLDYLKLHGCHCTHATVGYRSPAPSFADHLALVTALIEREGIHDYKTYNMCRWTEDNHDESFVSPSRQFCVVAVFRDEESSLQVANALDGKEFAELDFATFKAIRICMTQIRCPQEKFAICKPRLEAVKAAIHARSKGTATVAQPVVKIDSNDPKFVEILLFSRIWKQARELVEGFREILNGQILRDGGKVLWHDMFTQSRGIEMLKSFYWSGLYGPIKVANQGRYLYAFVTQEQRKTLEQLIKERLTSMTTFQQVIPLEPHALNASESLKYNLAVELFGMEHVRPYVNQSVPSLLRRPSMLVQVNIQDAHLLSHFATGNVFSELHSQFKTNSVRPVTEQCVICYSEPSSPLITQCSHTYCSDCFINMCRAAFSTGSSIRCLGGEDFSCGKEFAIEELDKYIGIREVGHLFWVSFKAYARRRPQQLRFCPTPDCNHVYRYTRVPAQFAANKPSKGSYWVCRNCLEAICLDCNAIHDFQRCAEYQQQLRTETNGESAWKSTHGFKDCENCGTPIEKTEGCPHVRCSSCLIHLCWICMTTFPTAISTYDHIRTVHGTVYDHGLEHAGDEDPDEADDEVPEQADDEVPDEAGNELTHVNDH